MISRPGKAFVSYGNYPALRVPIPDRTDEIYLFNCALEDSLHTIPRGLSGTDKVEVWDHKLMVIGEAQTPGAAKPWSISPCPRAAWHYCAGRNQMWRRRSSSPVPTRTKPTSVGDPMLSGPPVRGKVVAAAARAAANAGTSAP